MDALQNPTIFLENNLGIAVYSEKPVRGYYDY